MNISHETADVHVSDGIADPRSTIADGTATTVPGLTFAFGAERVFVSLSQFADGGNLTDIMTRLAQASAIVPGWDNILLLEDPARANFSAFVKDHRRKIAVRVGDEGVDPLSPFDATLALQISVNDRAQIGRWRWLLVRFGAIYHADAAESAAGAIRQAFATRGLDAPLPQVLQREIKDLCRADEVTVCASASAAAMAFICAIGSRGVSALQRRRRPRRLAASTFLQSRVLPMGSDKMEQMGFGSYAHELVRFLQSTVVDFEVRESFVRSVLLNMEGLGLWCDWEVDPPFISRPEAPQEIERRRVIACCNGFVDVDKLLTSGTPTLQRHDASLFNVTALPYQFDGNARYDLWFRTLSGILPERSPGDHRMLVIQEFFGLTLLEGKKNFDEILLLVGRGGNGKSTLLDVWTDLLGPANVSHVPIEALGSQFRSTSLLGKKANIVPEMSRPDKLDEGKLKAYSSGERQQFDQKHNSPIEGMSTASLIFAMNEIPKFNDRTDGIWRRLLIVPFLERFEGTGKDRHRAQRLKSELPGILNWAIEGLLRLLRQQAFTHCELCFQSVAEHRLACDPVRQFVADSVRTGPEFSICRADVYRAYVEFCRANGRQPVNSWDFGKEFLHSLPAVIPDRSPRQDRDGKRPPVYRGVTLYGHPLRFEPIRPRTITTTNAVLGNGDVASSSRN